MHTVEMLCLFFWCLCTLAWGSASRDPCPSPAEISGMLCVSSSKDDAIAWGHFHYDSTLQKLRFEEDSSHSNKTSHIDVIIDFQQNLMYELDADNKSCKKESLKSHEHPMQLPRSATHLRELYMGNLNKFEQGLRVRVWDGKSTESHSHYTYMTTSCGCLTVTCSYHGEKNDLIFSFFDLTTEVDPQVFSVPNYCEGVALEDDTDDHSFFDLFHN